MPRDRLRGSLSPAAYAEQGIALTQALMDACAPILDGKDTGLAIDAMAACFLALLGASGLSPRDARMVLTRFADRVMDQAEQIK